MDLLLCFTMQRKQHNAKDCLKMHFFFHVEIKNKYSKCKEENWLHH